MIDEASSRPFVSVLMPCRNEESFLGPCLDSVLAGDYPQDRLEILVLDGKSEDGTGAILDRYVDRHPVIRRVENPDRISAAAMNRGLREARGEIIVRLDVHASYPPDYISRCVQRLVESGADCVGGMRRTEPRSPGLLAAAVVAAESDWFGVGNAHYRFRVKQPRPVDTVFAPCYRRSLFERVGPFREDLDRSEDIELHRRLLRSGGRILLFPDIVSTYFTRSDFLLNLRHRWKDGIWAVRPLFLSRSASVSLRHLAPLFFVLGLACGAGWIWIDPERGHLGALVFCSAYLAANLLASLRSAFRKRDPRLLPVLPVVFFGIHASYGLGSLIGFLQGMFFRPRGKS